MAASGHSVPVTMLSGFLGSGKTTLLRELLSQSKYRIGCIVNDVASVNIDAKLVRNQASKSGPASSSTTSDLAPTIELQNGCACCSVQEELFMSFEQILAVTDRHNTTYDRIVLENSGVAEPQNIREAFAEAVELGHPIVKRVHLSTMITVVDSHTFIQEFACRNPVATRPDLGGDQSLFRPVVDLLVEQIEVADYVLLNKVDMLGEERVPELEAIIRSINPLCQVVPCSHGKVDMDMIFGPNAQALLANLNTEGQHRGYIAASTKAKQRKVDDEKGHSHSHDHDHRHGHGHDHKHDHGHDHKHDHDHDHKHDHGHDHKHGHDHGHDHQHDHGHAHPHDHKHDHKHDHSHGHDHKHDHKHGHGHDHHHHHHHNHAPGEVCDHPDHDHGPTTAETRFGITSFVYTRRKPFHPQRLREVVLQWMPVSHNKAMETTEAPVDNKSPMRAVMRSKGFAWMAHGHANAFYWSHAGQHFEMREEGDWWAAVPEDEWPTQPEKRAIVFSDFGSEFGDRRQEIVFIGAGMDQPAIEAALDQCLLNEEEMAKYVSNWAKLPDPEHPGAPGTETAA